jgi:hypothetical protein
MKAFLESQTGTIVMLFAGLLLFSIAVIICAAAMPANEKIYVFLTGIAGGFQGSLFTYLQVRGRMKDDQK